MDKKKKIDSGLDIKKHSFVNMQNSENDEVIVDPQGSWTGVPTMDPDDRPIQDADDL